MHRHRVPGDPAPADFGIAHYTAAGVLDPAFGAGGRVFTDFVGAADILTDLAVQPDGKIIAVGGAFVGRAFDFAVARYEAGVPPAVAPLAVPSPRPRFPPRPLLFSRRFTAADARLRSSRRPA